MPLKSLTKLFKILGIKGSNPQKSLKRCIEVLDQDGGENHKRQEVEAIITLSSLINIPEALDRLYEELCLQTRGEVALVAAVCMAKNINNPDVQKLLLKGFKEYKNVKKMLGQVPQFRILYAICLSDQLDILDDLYLYDFSDVFSNKEDSRINSLIQGARSNDISMMCKDIAWLEALDVGGSRSLLSFAKNRVPTGKEIFSCLAEYCVNYY